MKAGLSQEQLAARIGGSIDQTAVSRIENREGYEPGSFLLYRLAKALGTSVDDLLEGIVPISPPAEDSLEPRGTRALQHQVGQLAKNQADIVDALKDLRSELRDLREERHKPQQSQGRKRG